MKGGTNLGGISQSSDICGSFSFDCCSLRSVFLFYSAFSSLGRIVRHETKFPARESDEEWEIEIERDRRKGSGNRGTSYMISPESLKWSISGNALSYERATTGSRRGISLTKLPNHACIMRFADQKDTSQCKKWNSGRTRRSITPIRCESALSSRVFSCSEIKFRPAWWLWQNVYEIPGCNH